MRNRLISTTVVLVVAAAATAGCAQPTGTASEPERTAEITVDNTTRTGHVSCVQIEWMVTIDATAEQSRARAMLRLTGAEVVVDMVNIENFDGFNGVAGKGTGHAEASFADNAYTITGEAVGSRPDHPAESTTAQFRIKARC